MEGPVAEEGPQRGATLADPYEKVQLRLTTVFERTQPRLHGLVRLVAVARTPWGRQWDGIGTHRRCSEN